MTNWHDISTVPKGESVVVWAKKWHSLSDTFTGNVYYGVVFRAKSLASVSALNESIRSMNPAWDGLPSDVCPTHWMPLLDEPR